MAVVLLGTSCTSEVRKLIKSGDNDLMYRTGLELFEQQEYNKTIKVLTECEPYLNGTNREDSVIYYLSTAYYKTGNFDVSERLFDVFRRRYSNSPFLEDVEYMYCMSFYYSALPSNRDQSATLSAISSINEYLGRYPEATKKELLLECIAELTQRLHDKEFENAKTYYTIGEYKAAMMALQNAIEKYPMSKHKEDIMYLILESSYIYAKNSYEYLQRDRYLVMMDAYYNYIAEYPDESSSRRKEAEKMVVDARKLLDQYSED